MSEESTRPSARGGIPRATYRIQFNRTFTFRDAAEIAGYLEDLGISHLYASPYLQARPGSMHGYDISNHNAVNPEVGGREEHALLSGRLREHGLGQLLDIVPNHMGIAEESNAWWMDVLENGPSSRYAPFFDIDWHPLTPALAGRVLLPILGEQFGAVLEKGELQLEYAEGRFGIRYFEHRFPVAPRSSAAILREALGIVAVDLAEDDPERMELESLVTALEHLPPRDRTDAASVAERRREKVVTQRRLEALEHLSEPVRRGLGEALKRFNGTPGDPRSFDRLESLLDDQAYRLAYWRVAAEEINYRRFFDINDLAGVRVERDEVFAETHRLILELVRSGTVSGLRIDHPDGLYHPREYLRRLQTETSGRPDGDFYLLVEKILTGDETLPGDWPVAGTVGYEFMNRLNGLFVDPAGEGPLETAYARVVPRPPEFEPLIYDKKKLILRTALVSELNVLRNLLDRISERNRRFRDFTLGSLGEALRETIACFPVYRTYIDAAAGEVSDRDRAYVERAIRTARRRNPATPASIFEFIRGILLLRWPEGLDEEGTEQHAAFVMKFQQLTGPVMAKGVEDTSFYIYNRLISLNEVGGEPEHFGVSVEEFHRWIAERARRWPNAMCSTSTHDTKRSADVRARIDVLSEIPELWGDTVARWFGMNAPERRRTEEGTPIPAANDEYLLYQTLVGAWPNEGLPAEAHAGFVERIQQYMAKATREAKLHTSWINPDEEYDRGLAGFVEAILAPGGEFIGSLRELHARVAVPGMLNALSQTLLKLTVPGVPDTYQGEELWDLSLVDPDNRRPVDYDLRRRALAGIRDRAETAPDALARELLDRWTDGRVKLYVTWRALQLRKRRPDLFSGGAYLPLEARGARADHLVAFARTGGSEAVLVVAPRRTAALLRASPGVDPSGEEWRGTSVVGANGVLGGVWRNVFTGREIRGGPDGSGALDCGDLLEGFPLALLERVGD